MSNIDIEKMNKNYTQKRLSEQLADVPQELKGLAVEAFEYEGTEEYDKAIETGLKILEQNSSTDVEEVKILVARLFPKLLRTDIETENQNYQADVEKYYAFLESVTMNEVMQEYLVETLIRLCELMDNKWYRPLFEEFVRHIDQKGYLSEEKYQETLKSAYASMESFNYYDDVKINSLMKGYLQTCYRRAYTMKDEKLESVKNSMMIEALTNEWYVCQYYPGNEEVFTYIQETYPHSYELMADLVEAMEADVKAAADETLNKLLPYAAPGTTIEQLRIAMRHSYEENEEASHKPKMIYGGKGTYMRSGSKIGRNDPCPCGSGKKYKQCCGKKL
ncbi:MAG: YecA family protein [Roseburia sp.]